jgi:hypothetical protein
MAKAQTIYTTRPVMSVYYRGEVVVKVTHSAYPNNAVCNAIRHMQTNEYDATHAEVYSGDTGNLYAVIKWGIKVINILYRAKIDGYSKASPAHNAARKLILDQVPILSSLAKSKTFGPKLITPVPRYTVAPVEHTASTTLQ